MNTCEEKNTKTGNKTRGKSGSKGSKKSSGTSSASSGPCFVLATDCSGPDAPAVSSDCGLNSSVVRAWSSRGPGSGYPWAISRTVYALDCCCDDYDDMCC